MRNNGMVVCVCGLIVLVGLAGCGKSEGIERVTVQGKVTFDGKPVEKGIIAFLPSGETKGPSAGVEIKDGQYNIPKETGPTPGPHRIEITATRVEGKIEVQGIDGAQGGLSGAQTADNIVMYIPEKFNKNSELSYTVKPGPNTEDFNLVSK